MKRVLFAISAVLITASLHAEPWRPKERLRGFNLTGMMMQGVSPGEYEEQDFELIKEL